MCTRAHTHTYSIHTVFIDLHWAGECKTINIVELIYYAWAFLHRRFYLTRFIHSGNGQKTNWHDMTHTHTYTREWLCLYDADEKPLSWIYLLRRIGYILYTNFIEYPRHDKGVTTSYHTLATNSMWWVKSISQLYFVNIVNSLVWTTDRPCIYRTRHCLHCVCVSINYLHRWFDIFTEKFVFDWLNILLFVFMTQNNDGVQAEVVWKIFIIQKVAIIAGWSTVKSFILLSCPSSFPSKFWECVSVCVGVLKNHFLQATRHTHTHTWHMCVSVRNILNTTFFGQLHTVTHTSLISSYESIQFRLHMNNLFHSESISEEQSHVKHGIAPNTIQ